MQSPEVMSAMNGPDPSSTRLHAPVHRPRARPIGRALLVLGLAAALLAGTGCARVSMPRVGMPSLPSLGDDEEAADASATPRDLLAARLVNPRAKADTPGMTVGKLIEFADRYLACDCARTRFVRSWEKTPDGYRLLTNSEVVRPIEFVCRDAGEERECFLTEIDRGPQSASLAERYVPGSEFIQFMYDHGVRCERETPCP
jgi:hypothetical protein